MAHAPASLLLPPFPSQPLLFPCPVRSVHSRCPFLHHLGNVSGFQLYCEILPWEDRQSLICNGLTRLLRLLYGKSNIHPLETALQILHLDLSWASKMWFNPSWWCWAAAMSPGFRSPLWSWGKQPTPCRVLSCLSGEHYRLRVSCVLLCTIVLKLMMDLSRLIIVKFDVQTLWIYIKFTFPPQWQKVEHGICFAKLIT